MLPNEVFWVGLFGPVTLSVFTCVSCGKEIRGLQTQFTSGYCMYKHPTEIGDLCDACAWERHQTIAVCQDCGAAWDRRNDVGFDDRAHCEGSRLPHGAAAWDAPGVRRDSREQEEFRGG